MKFNILYKKKPNDFTKIQSHIAKQRNTLLLTKLCLSGNLFDFWSVVILHLQPIKHKKIHFKDIQKKNSKTKGCNKILDIFCSITPKFKL